MTNQQVVDFIRARVKEKVPLKIICEQLMDECLADHSDVGGVGCDNMTVIIVAFLQGKSAEEWYDWVGSKVSTPAPPKDAAPAPKETHASSEEESKDSTAEPETKKLRQDDREEKDTKLDAL